jgi:hypothetical protein
MQNRVLQNNQSEFSCYLKQLCLLVVLRLKIPFKFVSQYFLSLKRRIIHRWHGTIGSAFTMTLYTQYLHIETKININWTSILFPLLFVKYFKTYWVFLLLLLWRTLFIICKRCFTITHDKLLREHPWDYRGPYQKPKHS